MPNVSNTSHRLDWLVSSVANTLPILTSYWPSLWSA